MSGDVVKEAGATWSAWPERSAAESFTVGVEEEVMLLDRTDWSLSQSADELLPRVAAEAGDRVAPETHASAVEIETGVHATVAGARQELAGLRATVRETAARAGLAVASSGTHPFAVWQDMALGGGDRQAEVHETMRELVHREPTFALHVHVALPDADRAVQVFNRIRVHLPLLLALSANSPFWQGRDTGLASVRTPLFQASPRPATVSTRV